jgi:hypothetical protein
MKILFTTILTFFTFASQAQEIVWDSTFVVDQIEFKVLACRDDKGSFAQLVKSKTDTLTIDGVSGNIEILKFDNDDFLDITFSYLGNNYTADLFLYDNKSKSYKKVDGFMEVSDYKKLIPSPNYYYSYHRAGCADMNWVSNLFYIDNFRVYQIGEIYGKGCDFEESEREIEISKIVTLDKIIVIETLPIDSIESYDEHKWGFIKSYWNKNFEKFKNQKTP